LPSGFRSAEKRIEAVKKGNYDLVEPLDQMLLSYLPEVGTLALGLYPLGETVPNILKKFTPEQQKHLTSASVAARLRSMSVQGLAEASNSGIAVGGKNIWQRTKAGTTLVNKWKGANGGDSHGNGHN
jgi:hypothetical protein